VENVKSPGADAVRKLARTCVHALADEQRHAASGGGSVALSILLAGEALVAVLGAGLAEIVEAIDKRSP
jgi:hypothetical protein